MAYKTFIPSIGSTKQAGVGFLPVPPPKPEPADAVLTTPSGTDIIPAVITLSGDWLSGAEISVDFATDAPNAGSGSAVAVGQLTSNEMANDLADDLETKTNLTANAVGDTVEVLAISAAGTVDLSNLVVTQ